ncbi:MAG TPA: YqgE/AlgH family protein [Candidatus Sulfotelmatobacter sp.]|nr:YqgE/AlgH family protein [Candidatus Sulfotelmatobacter sp.]
MYVRNLCFFMVLAAIVAFPAVRTLEVEIRQSTRTANSPNIETPPAVVLPVQSSRNPRDLGPGKLLVASRELGDPNFAETVILLVHYDTEGVIGLMLNRRTHLPISRVLAQLKPAQDLSDPVYLGGPVGTPTVFALLRSTDKLEDAEQVFGGVYWISTKPALEKTISSHPDPGVFHVYLGYAGWTTAQLRNEVRLGGWHIFLADNQTVFNANPDSLWHEMIRKTDLKMAEVNTASSPQGPAIAAR